MILPTPRPYWLGPTDSNPRRCYAVKPGVGRCSKKVHRGGHHVVGDKYEYETFWLAPRRERP